MCGSSEVYRDGGYADNQWFSLHVIVVTEHTLQMPFLYNVAFMHQLHTPQISLNSQMNMNHEQFEISLHSGN